MLSFNCCNQVQEMYQRQLQMKSANGKQRQYADERTENAQVHATSRDLHRHSHVDMHQSVARYQDERVSTHKRPSRDSVQSELRDVRRRVGGGFVGSFFGQKSGTSSSSRTSKSNSNSNKTSAVTPLWANKMSYHPARIRGSNTTPSSASSSGYMRRTDAELIERPLQYPYSSRHVVTEQARKLQSFLHKQSSKSLLNTSDTRTTSPSDGNYVSSRQTSETYV